MGTTPAMSRRSSIFPLIFFLVFLGVTALATVVAAADAPPKIDAGDTAWVLTASAMVLLMTPGLAFFYGGLVRRKNILSVLMQCFVIICIVSIQWVYFGYSLSFGPDVRGLIGDLSWFGLKGVGADAARRLRGHDPARGVHGLPDDVRGHHAGARHRRFRGADEVLGALPLHAALGDLRLRPGDALGLGRRRLPADRRRARFRRRHRGAHQRRHRGARSGADAGRRLGYPDNVAPPHNLPFAVLGAGLLWFGWFGFNAGSALSAGAVAGGAFVATHLAGSAAGLAWALMDWMYNGRPTVLGIITGSVAGLAAVTPASGFVNPTGAIWIGIGAAAICYYTAVILKSRLGYDDTLDAFGVHGVGGIWGVLATGLFATKAVNSLGADGLFYGGGSALLGSQVKATLATAAWSLSGRMAYSRHSTFWSACA